MKARLNKRTVDDAIYQGPGSCYIWDTQLSAFGVRIYPSERKSFVVSYCSRGRRRFFTLGQYGRMTVQQARVAALEVFLRVRRGEDPAADRRAAKHAPTVAELADRHIEEHAKVKNKPSGVKRARQLWNRSILPQLGKRKVADIQRADVARLMTEMSKTPALANRALSLLSKSFNLAEVWGWRPEGSNPCRHVERYKEEGRERYLSESELQRLGEVLDRAERERWVSASGIAAIRLLILTGCRSSEILKLRWDEVDFERRCLQLPDSKTGRRTVVLNTAALRILADLEPVEGNPYVIPGGKKGGHLSSLQNLWHRVRAEADIKDVRIHDLRHTYASIGVNTGQSLSVVGKLLGHSKILTTQRYAHLADDPVRTANEQIGATIEATLSGGALSLGLCQQRSHPATRSPAAPVGFAGGVPAELSTSIWSLIEHIARVSVNVAVRAARQCPKLGGDNVMQLDRATSPVLLTEKEASRILGFSKRTLQKWRLQGRGPTFVRVSPRAIRYLRDDLESWIKERLRTSMSDTTEEQEVSEGTPIPELKTETHAARPTPTPADADSAG